LSLKRKWKFARSIRELHIYYKRKTAPISIESLIRRVMPLRCNMVNIEFEKDAQLELQENMKKSIKHAFMELVMRAIAGAMKI